nr:hypothetical protein [uncultured Blautia sp.]
MTKAKQKAEKYGIPPLFNNALHMTQYDIDHLIAPVYLGFGSLACNHSIFRLDTHRNPAYLCGITNY